MMSLFFIDLYGSGAVLSDVGCQPGLPFSAVVFRALPLSQRTYATG